MARVERVRDYLAAGDVYQVNIARRHVARITTPGDPLALYTALAATAPAPYGALIEADGLDVDLGIARALPRERRRAGSRPGRSRAPARPDLAAPPSSPPHPRTPPST